MEKKKPERAIRIVLVLAILVLLLIVVFCISYCSVSEWYKNRLDAKDEALKKAEEATAQALAEESMENCVFTMLYLDDPDTGEVDYCALQIFDHLNQKMSIFMIPTDSLIHMTSSLCRELSEKAGMEVPQELFLNKIGTYYPEARTKYEMTTKAVQEMIGGVGITSYEALDYEALVKVIDLAEPVKFQPSQIVTFLDENNESQQLTTGKEYDIDGRKALGILTYSDGFGAGDGGRIEQNSSYLMEYVTSITARYTKEQMSEYLSNYRNLIVTDGTIDDANSYLEDCMKLDQDSLSFYTFKGTQKGQAFILEPDRIQNDIKILMGEEAFSLATTEQTEALVTASGESIEEMETSSEEQNEEADSSDDGQISQ